MRLFSFLKGLLVRNNKTEECNPPVNLQDERKVKELVIRTIIATGENKSADLLLDVLCGMVTLQVQQAELMRTPYFGCLSGRQRHDVEAIIDALIRDGYLRAKDSRTMILCVTRNGTLYLEGKMSGATKAIQKPTEKKVKPRYPLSHKEYVDKVRSAGNTNAYNKWSKNEEERLIRSYQEGKTLSVIAKEHKRTVGAIRKRLEVLGYEDGLS